MYYEFYIDQFFAEQLLSDYLLLAAAVRMLGIKVSGKRLAAGSVAGAVLVTVLTCIQLADWQMIGMLGAGAVVFRGEERKKLLTDFGMLLFVTACFGGIMEAAVELWKLPIVCAAVLSAAVHRLVSVRKKRAEKKQELIAEVRLWWAERSVQTRGIIDTGNRLTEPLTGRPVSVLEASCAGELLGECWESRKGFFMIPYHSLGTEKSWMQGVTVDRMRVETVQGAAEIENPVIAVYQGRVSTSDDYRMILHREHAEI